MGALWGGLAKTCSCCLYSKTYFMIQMMVITVESNLRM